MNRPYRLFVVTRLWGVRHVVVFVALAIVSTTAAARDAEFDVALATTVMVPMRDGVRLATDVYLPRAAGSRSLKNSRRSSPALRTVAPVRMAWGDITPSAATP